MNILKPNDFYAQHIEKHIDYYSTYENFEQAKLALLDDIFNVIGNYIDDSDQLIAFISSKNKSFNLLHTIDLFNKEIINKKNDLNFNPYPNFQKEYSIVYVLNFESLGDKKEEWINEIIYFYEYCIQYLNSEESKCHYDAYPTGDTLKDNFTISEFKGAFEKYDNHKDISEAYEQAFDGNIEEFLTIRWENTKKEWVDFSEKTIEYLKGQL